MKLFRYTPLIIALLLVPFIAGAATFYTGETYMLSKGSSIEGDIYTVAGNITVSGPVNGDLLAAGGDIVVNARVSGDAAIVGGSVNILGVIGDDLRIVAGDIKIDQPINGDLVGFGGKVYLSPDVLVLGDMAFAAGSIRIEGRINGDLKIRGEEVTISGIVQGDADIKAEKITISSGAIIVGDLIYVSSSEANISSDADIRGEIIFNEKEPISDEAPMAVFAMLSLAKLVILLVTALVLVLFVKTLTQRIVRKGVESFGQEFLWGAVSFIVVPVVAFVLLITFFGAFFGVIAVLLYVVALVMASIFSGLLFGAILEKVITKKTPSVGWQWSVLGIVALHLIGLIPIVGWVFKFVFLLASFGVLIHLTYKAIQARR